MLKQALTATLSILLFRAGPQDFPYSEDRGLTRACVAVAVLANALLFGLSAPPLVALAAGIVVVGGLAMFVRMTLRLRKLDSRYAQTLNALLATGSVLILLMRLPIAEVMPQINAFVNQVQQNPELADQPGNWPVLPTGPALLVDVLAFWLLAVTAHILRHAGNFGLASGAMIGLLCVFNVMLFLVFAAPLLAIFAG